MSIRTVIVDNDKELLDKLSGILKEMGQIDLVGCFEHPADPDSLPLMLQQKFREREQQPNSDMI